MLTLTANLRTHYKKSATRKLRQLNKCPAIIYGGDNYPNLTIELNQHTIQHPEISIQLYQNNTILLNITHNIPLTVKIQKIQYHPFKLQVTHIDFLRILHKN